jgi:hypothetical protein
MAEQLSFGLVITDPDAYRIEAARKSRRCLSCSTDFLSHGPGNRVCPRCRSSELFTCSPAEYSVAAF